MSPMHPDHYSQAVLDRRAALRDSADRSARWSFRAGGILVRAGEGLRAIGGRLQSRGHRPVPTPADCR